VSDLCFCSPVRCVTTHSLIFLRLASRFAHLSDEETSRPLGVVPFAYRIVSYYIPMRVSLLRRG
jgi:hypothetical protein